MAYDTDDVIEKRKRRHRLRMLRNFVIFLLIAGFCGYLYLQRDAWIPKLEGIGGRYETVTQNDGELAEGNFPLTISGNTGYQAELVNDTLFILHDSYLDLYSIHGDAQDSRQHAYQNAVLSTAGKYSLIYERDGTLFRVDTKNKNIYSKSLDDNIISGVVSESGYVALITESSAYACTITVFDETGKRIYQRNCIERVIDVVFHNDGDGICFTSIDTDGGAIQGTVTSVLFHQADTQWTSLPLDTLVVNTGFSSDDVLCVIGNTACAYYSKTGEVLGTYTYNGTLIHASIENGRAALIIQDDQKHQTSLVLLDRSVDSLEIVSIDTDSTYVSVVDGDAIVMENGTITSYDFSGSPIAIVFLESAYTSFMKQDGYVFLLGYDQVDRVDFKE